MRMSEITLREAAQFCRLDTEDLSPHERQEFETIIKAAKEFVKSYIGLSETEIDEHEDITLAALVIIGDMYDNRARYVQNSYSQPNKTVECILGMYCQNLL